MKKLLIMVLVLSLLVTTAYAFPDARGHWAEGVIMSVSQNRPDVIGGYPDGTVKPNGTVTRAEFMKMIIAGLRADIKNTSNAKFTDITNHWAAGNIHTAVQLGILVPSEEGTKFNPSTGITREDMAKYTVRALGYATPTSTVNFKDASQVSSGHRKYVATAAETGLIGGYPDGTFGPKKTLTRAEAFAIIDRFLTQLQSGPQKPPEPDKPTGTLFSGTLIKESQFTHNSGATYGWDQFDTKMKYIKTSDLPHWVGTHLVEKIEINQSGGYIDITYFRNNTSSTTAPAIVLAIGNNITALRSAQEVVSQATVGSGIRFIRRYSISAALSNPDITKVTHIMINVNGTGEILTVENPLYK